MAQTAQAVQEQSLAVVDPVTLKQELTPQTAKEDPELDKQAGEFASKIVAMNFADQNAQTDTKAAVETMGADLQKRAGAQSKLLLDPVQKLAKRSDDGGEVANALVSLKLQVEDLDPGKVDLEAGWFTRLVGMLPGVGLPLKRYFTKYESAQTVINAIIRSLENGREQLKRDNITLAEDQKRMREMTVKLARAAKLGQLIDAKLQNSLERDIKPDDPKTKFIQEELQFPLRQRCMDLQQQLAVNQQGVIAAELIIRNNAELIRGVSRALNVTVSALEVAVTVAMALADQKIVLDKINAISATTNNLIAGTASRLRTQGAEIHKQASSTQLSIDTLKTAFADIHAAMDDIARFRADALPKMATAILEMDTLTTQAEGKIRALEDAKRARPNITINVE